MRHLSREEIAVVSQGYCRNFAGYRLYDLWNSKTLYWSREDRNSALSVCRRFPGFGVQHVELVVSMGVADRCVDICHVVEKIIRTTPLSTSISGLGRNGINLIWFIPE